MEQTPERGNGTATYSPPTSSTTFINQPLVENKIESWTKSVLAILVVSGTMIGGILAMVYNIPIPTVITAFAGIIIGWYFRDATK